MRNWIGPIVRLILPKRKTKENENKPIMEFCFIGLLFIN